MPDLFLSLEILITGIVLLTKPTSIIIRNIISIWTPEKKAKDNSLENAGNYIGILERLFIFCFILTNHFEAIGFLLAAKSIFRFGDLKEAKDRLDKGRPIAMFPEGTRSDGKQMLSFRPGAKILANRYNLRVQPIILFNTRNIVDSKSLKAAPGIVKVVFLDTIQASKDTTWFEETEERMKELFNKEYKNYVS